MQITVQNFELFMPAYINRHYIEGGTAILYVMLLVNLHAQINLLLHSLAVMIPRTSITFSYIRVYNTNKARTFKQTHGREHNACCLLTSFKQRRSRVSTEPELRSRDAEPQHMRMTLTHNGNSLVALEEEEQEEEEAPFSASNVPLSLVQCVKVLKSKLYIDDIRQIHFLY